jgi:hypothetical protein
MSVERAVIDLTLREGGRMVDAMFDGSVLILGGVGSGKTELIAALRERAAKSGLSSVTLDPIGYGDRLQIDSREILVKAMEMVRTRAFSMIAIDHTEGVDFRDPENSRDLARLFEMAQETGVTVVLTSNFGLTGVQEEGIAETGATVALMDPFGRSRHIWASRGNRIARVTNDLLKSWSHHRHTERTSLPVGAGWMLSLASSGAAYGRAPLAEGS